MMTMIARRWHGIVPKSRAEAYLKLMVEIAIPDYESVAGNRGAWCLHREDGDAVHVEMLTFWDDLEAVEGFAGSPIDTAKYYDFDAEFLIEKEPHVLHFKVSETP